MDVIHPLWEGAGQNVLGFALRTGLLLAPSVMSEVDSLHEEDIP
jgi:hypothetical protein